MDWKSSVLEWLEENERSQAWLAMKAGYTAVHLNRCLHDKHIPSDRMLRQLEHVMEMPYGLLLRNGARAG